MTLGVSDCFNAEKGRYDDPQAVETCATVIWIDPLRNIKQRKCWQHNSGPKIGNYKKSLELTTRTSSCVDLANAYDIFFRQEQLTQSEYAFVSSNDNRNLRKCIIDFIVKITNVFSNRATSEHSTTLLKFIYIVWATPKRFFVTTTWNNQTKTKPSLSRWVKSKVRARGERETTKILFSKCNRISRDSQWTDCNSIFLNTYQKEREKPSSE